MPTLKQRGKAGGNGAFSAAPYRVIDRRGSVGWGGRNDLYESAAATGETRQKLRGFDRDIHSLTSSQGRRQMMTAGRWLFANFPSVHAMVLEQANLAVGSWIPQYDGEDKDWGNLAENWLYEWHKIMDWRGWPYDYNTFVQHQIIAPIRDGDIGTLLVNGPSNYPFVQLIPAHRIGSPVGVHTAQGGQYDGARIIDGVIVDDYGRAQAYRVWQEHVGVGEFMDIDTRNMALTFFPKWADQLRGFPDLASGLDRFQDAKEVHDNEILAQKAASAIALIETNESGEADSAKSVIRTKAVTDNSRNLTAPPVEEIAGGTIRYLRARDGSDITTLEHNRPGQNAMLFLDSCMRDAFQSAEWNYYFSVDPSKVSGAAQRVIVDRINRVIRKRRVLAEKISRRVDGWAISKAVELKLLPENEDWFRWEYQGPADVTADRKYDSDVDVQELNAGFRTLQDVCARRNSWWEDVQDQRLREELREQEKREEMGLPPKVQSDDTVDNRPPREPDANQGKPEGEE